VRAADGEFIYIARDPGASRGLRLVLESAITGQWKNQKAVHGQD
jgi:hypothetical protein